MKKILLGMVAVVAASSGSAQAAVLFDNGSVTNSGNLSILRAPFGTFGVGTQSTSGNIVADNFTASAAWTVQSFDFFAYQTGAPNFGFTTATWRIISGSINGGTVVASGTTAVTNGGVVGFRVDEAAPTDRSRAIYRLNASVGDINLAAGNYFLAWTLAGNAAFSGPWTPVLPGSEGTGNAYQALANGSFALLTDEASGQSFDLPFRVNGVVSNNGAVPEPATWAMMIVGFGLIGGAMRRRVSKVSYA